MEIVVRLATTAEAPVIAAANAAMARETEGLELDPDRLRAGVAAVLTDPAKGTYWVAEYGGRFAGQLLITYEWSDWRNGLFWWVQSVYVMSQARGHGVYRSLYQYVRNQARSTPGVCGLRLYVEEHNTPAQEVYLRQGMKKTAYLVFEDDFVIRTGSAG
jgi:GNAT superfamily N-acetyltransferase